VKILLDVCLSPDWVSFFDTRAIESVHWSSIGPRDSRDIDIFRHARECGFILFTHDLDFGTMLAQSQSGRPSVIQARVQDISPKAIGDSICDLIRQFERELRDGALITLLPNRTKVRVLPIY
jgi:predicted nuclease of predicted toxin-antitoxin system